MGLTNHFHIDISIVFEISIYEMLKFNRMYVEKLIGKYFSVVHIHYKIMYRQESWIFQRMHLGNDRLTSSRRNSWKEDIFGYLLSWVYRTVLVLLPSLLRELSIFLLLLRGTVGFWKVHCVYQENVHWQFLLIYSLINKIFS